MKIQRPNLDLLGEIESAFFFIDDKGQISDDKIFDSNAWIMLDCLNKKWCKLYRKSYGWLTTNSLIKKHIQRVSPSWPGCVLFIFVTFCMVFKYTSPTSVLFN